MRARIINLFLSMQSSYWFVPTLMVLGAIVLAMLSDQLDRSTDASFLSSIPWLYQNQPAGARAVLSAIATSMIGVAGVTFSMTLVSVSFAASNIGPRLIGNFMSDRGNQVTLGTFIATFVYCLLILRTVTDASGASDLAHVPHISILIALTLAMLSVGNLIFFIHHIPESINVAGIAHNIAANLQDSMQQLFPEQVGESGADAAAGPPDLGPKFRVESRAVPVPETGYMQLVDHDTLMTIACDKDLIVRLEYRPGDFAQTGQILIHAHPSARVDAQTADALAGCCVFGSKRTAAQNVMFLVDQLVEILMRALSPGVNDPFTAVGCLDWLQASMTISVQRAEIDPCRYDEDGALRLAVHPISFEQFASAVFDQPLQYVAADRTAALRMMQMIAELVTVCDYPARTDRLLYHAERLNEAGKRCLPVESDKEDLNSRYEQTLKIAKDLSYRQELRDGQGWLGGRG